MNLFVYGTLKSNFDNDFAKYLRGKATYMGQGKVFGRMYLLGWYPGIILDKDGYEIIGEVYHLSLQAEEVLAKLDDYEGVELGDYRRVLRTIFVNDLPIKCWVYETLIETDIEIKSGEFLAPSN